MIVVERQDEYVMITQHEHALVSAEFARFIPSGWYQNENRREDVLFAIAEHDRGWIDPDLAPLWNAEKKAPYSFMDSPLEPKLSFYQKGVNEVEALNPYAALLCSLHYASFFEGEDQPIEVIRYLEQERERQQMILQNLKLNTIDILKEIDFHFRLLQFCDNASLFLCLNEPGVTKEKEISWYQNGFKQTFSALQHQVMIPEWQSKHEVSFAPFPFSQQFTLKLPLKRVKKVHIFQYGLANAYRQADHEEREITVLSTKGFSLRTLCF